MADKMISYNILIVDDDPIECYSSSLIIEKIPRCKISTALSGKDAIDILLSENGREIDLVLLDICMPDMSGIDVIRSVSNLRPDLLVIIYTAYGDMYNVVEALREGAVDFIEKQNGSEKMLTAVENALNKQNDIETIARLKKVVSGQVDFSDIIGKSNIIEKTKIIATRAAKSSIPVLIKGESGVGKEVFARAIHYSSKRHNKAFVPVNCGAIPKDLVESVLFGHEKGSFTGAIEKTIGKFREASGGTLFLDEVGELKPDMQVKLLRALQEGEIEPVGASAPVKVDVRFISATNINLKTNVSEGNFRQDLYYRLNVFPFTIPALRNRSEDIEELTEYFCHTIATKENKKIIGITEEAKNLLKAYSWPGNVRQLENSIYRAIVLCDNEYLSTEDFSQIQSAIHLMSDDDIIEDNNNITDSKYTLYMVGAFNHFKEFSKIEHEVIESALEFYNWHISEVARRLHIGRSTLYRKISEFGIEAPKVVKRKNVSYSRSGRKTK